jgi:hypothetical protein
MSFASPAVLTPIGRSSIVQSDPNARNDKVVDPRQRAQESPSNEGEGGARPATLSRSSALLTLRVIKQIFPKGSPPW